MILRSLSKLGAQVTCLGKKLYILLKPQTSIAYAEGAVDFMPLLEDETLVSILMPVFNPNELHLREAVDSIVNQTHNHIEAILVNDGSTDSRVFELLSELESKYEVVRVFHLPLNAGIAAASQKALELANGEWVGLLDQDDLLELNAVETMLGYLKQTINAHLAYSDSDKISTNKQFVQTFLKPDWSPERLRGNMYLAHFTFFRREAAISVGGFNSKFDGAQDHDLVLRISEKYPEVVHAPEVLYHWRMTPTSTAMNASAKSYARDAGKLAIEDHLKRVELNAVVNQHEDYPGFYFLERQPSENSKVSVVIPTRGGSGRVLGEEKIFVIRCIESIMQRPQEILDEVILVVDLVEDMTYIDHAKSLLGEKLKIVEYDRDFNFSQKVNEGIAFAKNEFILLLNDDVQIMSDKWLDQMVGILEQPEVGAVGPLLYFEDKTIQHGGHFYAHGGATHRYLSEHFSPGYFGDLILEHEVSGVTAAYMLIRKSVWKELGGFSLDFPNNFNDVDYCLKLRRKNLRIIFTPLVQAYHFESKSRDSSVHWSEVARLQERWGAYLGLGREPFGPGGMPKGFLQPKSKSKRSLGKGSRLRFLRSKQPKQFLEDSGGQEFISNYRFSINFVSDEIEDGTRAYITSQFDQLVKAFNSSYQMSHSKQTRDIEIWITANLNFSSNFLSETVKAFDKSEISFLYSDFVESQDESQSIRKLPAWSPERFLGIDFIGPCFVIEPSSFGILNSGDQNQLLMDRNSKLMELPIHLVGRIPDITYRSLSTKSSESPSIHQTWSANWIEVNRTGATHALVEDGLIQHSYKAFASGLVSIIIPTRFSVDENYGEPVIVKCLNSISNQAQIGISLEVILVVDTDCDESLRRKAVDQFSKDLSIKEIDFDPPFNFSKKCNVGVENSSGEVLVFLNDDAEWISENALREMVGTLKFTSKIGAVGALLRYPNQLIQHAGMIFTTPGPGHAYRKQRESKSHIGDAKVMHEVSGVTGACIAIKRDTLSLIGGWNEEFPSSYNDVDLCATLRRSGFSIVINPLVELLHYESLTRDPYAKTSEIDRLLKRNADLLTWEPFMRTSIVHGVDDLGNVLLVSNEPNYSGKYLKYAVHLLRTRGFRYLVDVSLRNLSGKSKTWKQLTQVKSIH